MSGQYRAPYSEEGAPYEDRLVLFIDFLGVSSYTMSTGTNNEKAKNLVGLLDRIVGRDTKSYEQDETGWAKYIGYMGRRCLAFSDCAVFSVRPDFKEPAEIGNQALLVTNVGKSYMRDSLHLQASSCFLPYLPLSTLLAVSAEIQLMALEHGFASRGAITHGPMRHHKGVVVGPAFVRATELEKKMGMFPFIRISQDVLERYWEPYRDLISYRGYLRGRGSDEPPAGLDRSFIDAVLEHEVSDGWVSEIDATYRYVLSNKDFSFFNGYAHIYGQGRVTDRLVQAVEENIEKIKKRPAGLLSPGKAWRKGRHIATWLLIKQSLVGYLDGSRRRYP